VLKKSLVREEKEKGAKERIKRGETTLDIFGLGAILKSRGLTEEE
jgi:hypothetical protein